MNMWTAKGKSVTPQKLLGIKAPELSQKEIDDTRAHLRKTFKLKN